MDILRGDWDIMEVNKRLNVRHPIMHNYINNTTDTTYIIANRIYGQSLHREIFRDVKSLLLKDKEFKDMKFKSGYIKDDSINIKKIMTRKGYSRVRFISIIPYEVIYSSGVNIKKSLPEIHKDIILYIPKARDEFNFKILISTDTRLLDVPKIVDNHLVFSSEVFFIIKLVGRVQLLIPSYGTGPNPSECEEFRSKDKILDEFKKQPFPRFYPLQYKDLFPEC